MSDGYQEMKWEDVEYRMIIPENLVLDFEDDWNPKKVVFKRCFSKRISNEWTGGGNHYYLVAPTRVLSIFMV